MNPTKYRVSSKKRMIKDFKEDKDAKKIFI